MVLEDEEASQNQTKTGQNSLVSEPNVSEDPLVNDGDGDIETDDDDGENEGAEEIRNHKSFEQVMLDVNRCAGRLEHIKRVYLHRTDDDEPAEDLTEEFNLEKLANETGLLLDSKSIEFNRNNDDDDDHNQGERGCKAKNAHDQRELKRKLANLIVKLLIKKPDLYYYQGFHDVCLTYMIILGQKEAYHKLDKLIDTHFKTFMLPTMNETQDFLNLIPVIVGLHDSKLQAFLEQSEVGTIFALSWVITWFSHVIPKEHDVERIFKFLEEQDPHMVLYLSSEIVLHTRDRLLALQPEMSTVHHFLCQVPRKEKLPLDKLLKNAKESFSKYSPEFIKQRLEESNKRLQLQNYNIVRSLASRFGPAINSIVASSNARTALMVFVLASAMAFQFDRWTR